MEAGGRRSGWFFFMIYRQPIYHEVRARRVAPRDARGANVAFGEVGTEFGIQGEAKDGSRGVEYPRNQEAGAGAGMI